MKQLWDGTLHMSTGFGSWVVIIILSVTVAYQVPGSLAKGGKPLARESGSSASASSIGIGAAVYLGRP